MVKYETKSGHRYKKYESHWLKNRAIPAPLQKEIKKEKTTSTKERVSKESFLLL